MILQEKNGRFFVIGQSDINSVGRAKRMLGLPNSEIEILEPRPDYGNYPSIIFVLVIMALILIVKEDRSSKISGKFYTPPATLQVLRVDQPTKRVITINREPQPLTNEQKGTEFEKYTREKFPDKVFDFLEWRGDKSYRYSKTDKKSFNPPKSDLNPDLTFTFRPGKIRFAVECKYRSSVFRNSDHPIAVKNQIARYKRYATNEKLMFLLLLVLV